MSNVNKKSRGDEEMNKFLIKLVKDVPVIYSNTKITKEIREKRAMQFTAIADSINKCSKSKLSGKTNRINSLFRKKL